MNTHTPNIRVNNYDGTPLYLGTTKVVSTKSYQAIDETAYAYLDGGNSYE